MMRIIRQRMTRSHAVWLAVVALGIAGCSLDGLLKSDQLPPDLADPAITQTPEGALAAYRGTVVQFRQAFGNAPFSARFASSQAVSLSFVPAAGLLSDELRRGDGGGSDVDQRILPEGGSVANFDAPSSPFGLLQKVRGQAGQTIGLLTRYAPDSQSLASHMYALEGYAEVLLAELYCSGIPLSTLDYEGDYTLQPGSTTDQVFTHAAALFDTALALAGDSVRFQYLAAVGKARALLGLGQYAAAAAAAAVVPDDYRYLVSYSAATNASATNFVVQYDPYLWIYSVADSEGHNGLNYVTAGDPRIQVTFQGTTTFGVPGLKVYLPNKYATDGSSPIVLASGVEARLIGAEASLQAGDITAWLTQLNQLRETAISPALPDTTDPGTSAARVDLLFRERAFWLFLTGHRQGDLRRLIRQYGRSSGQVYPTGVYPAQLTAFYGDDVTMPVPSAEAISNPLFSGCASRGA